MLDPDYGQVNFNVKAETYTGYDITNSARFCVTFKQLMETAAYSEDFYEFLSNNYRNGLFDLSIMGGGKFSLNPIIKAKISEHFWEQYKAITG